MKPGAKFAVKETSRVSTLVDEVSGRKIVSGPAPVSVVVEKSVTCHVCA